ncbi:GNAT family N-acetyltransferase [Fuerstiella marisgermanici]|uniref:Acetyltransferase (GNAT) family protein n=1 Tax=Fuerstiella marisgermanici TaxID=1891926 RepID=A0A1P8WH31_9PLAN|nr:GNAT family protein [Fuerstiella marisgermanici]APZ93350.1 Acetyltransferase (GNAT) family protein [Fuerstiella marisgermanici]
MKLVEIENSTDVAEFRDQHELLNAVVDSTVALYQKVGFLRPWIGYLAVENGRALGTCGFKSPPANGQAEIAYFTFPEHEGKGVATWMARQIVKRAQDADNCVTIAAQTLPAENASTSILRKLGFRFIGTVEHDEDGTVWEWKLTSDV